MQADLRHIGRPVARQAALALDAFDHRRLFAADIGARAPAQMHAAGRGQVPQPRDLGRHDFARHGIFVAEIDGDGVRLDRPGGDQRAFQHGAGRGLEEMAVLEGAGLALVGIDGQVARLRPRAHEAPFARAREARAAHAAQARRLDLGRHLFAGPPAFEAGAELRVIPMRRCRDRMPRLVRDGRAHRLRRRPVHMAVSGLDDRRAVAAAHAGRGDDPRLREGRAQGVQQRRRARQLAGEAVADAQGERRRRVLALLHRVEMGVEGRDLPDLRHGEPHFFRQRRQVPRGEMPEAALEPVQIFDQELAPARCIAQQRLHLRQRLRLDLAPLGLRAPATALLDRFFRHVPRVLPADPSAPIYRPGRAMPIARMAGS